MKNIFDFQINDYAYIGMHAYRIDMEIMREHLLSPNPSEIITPIPFSFKVLDGIQGRYYMSKKMWIACYDNFRIHIYKEKSTNFLYANDNNINYYFRHLHTFQRYMREKFNYELPFEELGYNLRDHVNGLSLIRDYVFIDGKIVLNEDAFKTRKHFGYGDY
ncbi:MAG: hypothetical protein JXR53_08065 [Bacteroidales bacterium]|nr:hypothetical protein [Bacteroidales bacterium]